MKKSILAVLLAVSSGSALAGEYFDSPRATPAGAPNWISLPVELHSESKFCQDQGYRGSSPVKIEYNSNTSMYVAENLLGDWEAKFSNPQSGGVNILTRVFCFD